MKRKVKSLYAKVSTGRNKYQKRKELSREHEGNIKKKKNVNLTREEN